MSPSCFQDRDILALLNKRNSWAISPYVTTCPHKEITILSAVNIHLSADSFLIVPRIVHIEVSAIPRNDRYLCELEIPLFLCLMYHRYNNLGQIRGVLVLEENCTMMQKWLLCHCERSRSNFVSAGCFG